MNITHYRLNAGWWALACGILGIMGIGLLILLLNSSPAEAQDEPEVVVLHEYFAVSGWAERRSELIWGQIADWESPMGALYQFFSPYNPEVMVKILDTRRINDHWNLYMGSLSDNPTTFVAAVPDSRNEVDEDNSWVVLIGRMDYLFDVDGRDGRRVYCALPWSRLSRDGRCSIVEWGQSAIVKFAWDRSGRIPHEHRANYTKLDGLWTLPLREETIEKALTMDRMRRPFRLAR